METFQDDCAPLVSLISKSPSKHHFVRGAEFAYLREIAGGGMMTPASPLDRLDEEGTWSFDEISKRYVVVLNGRHDNVSTLNPEGRGVCMLIAGDH
jgi:hypothetical protein